MYKKIAVGFYSSSRETRSFMGGSPFLSSSGWPRASNGEPYNFIFQIHLEDSGLTSRKGVLQFFTHPSDVHGLDFDDYTRSKTLVRFLPEGEYDESVEVDPHYTEHTPLSTPERRVFFKSKRVEMTPFSGSIEYDDMQSNLSEAIDEDDYFDESLKNQSFEFYLGGFPDFVQADFRESIDELPELLAGSISGDNIMWGDMGSATWWYPHLSDALEERLDDVFFYWDCA